MQSRQSSPHSIALQLEGNELGPEAAESVAKIIEKFKEEYAKKNHGTKVNFTNKDLSTISKVYIKLNYLGVDVIGVTAAIWGVLVNVVNTKVGVLFGVATKDANPPYNTTIPGDYTTGFYTTPSQSNKVFDYVQHGINHAGAALIIETAVSVIAPFFSAIRKTVDSGLSKNYATDSIAQKVLQSKGYDAVMKTLEKTFTEDERENKYKNIYKACKKTSAASQFEIFIQNRNGLSGAYDGLKNTLLYDSTSMADFALHRLPFNFWEDFCAGFPFNPNKVLDYGYTSQIRILFGSALVGLANALINIPLQNKLLSDYNVANVGVFEKNTSWSSFWKTLGSNLIGGLQDSALAFPRRAIARAFGRVVVEDLARDKVVKYNPKTKKFEFPNLFIHCAYEGLRSGLGQQGAIRASEQIRDWVSPYLASSLKALKEYFFPAEGVMKHLKTTETFFSIFGDKVDLNILAKVLSPAPAQSSPQTPELEILATYRKKLSEIQPKEQKELIEKFIKIIGEDLDKFKSETSEITKTLQKVIEYEADRYEKQFKKYKTEEINRLKKKKAEIEEDIKKCKSEDRLIDLMMGDEGEEIEHLTRRRDEKQAKIEKLEEAFELPGSFTSQRIVNLACAREYFAKLQNKFQKDERVTMVEIHEASSALQACENSLNFIAHDSLTEKKEERNTFSNTRLDDHLNNLVYLDTLKKEALEIFKFDVQFTAPTNVNNQSTIIDMNNVSVVSNSGPTRSWLSRIWTSEDQGSYYDDDIEAKGKNKKRVKQTNNQEGKVTTL